jgi:16S rRNA (uracil1498-N3)-methyltransferase
MRLHRFFVSEEVGKKEFLTLSDREVIHQWKKVFRFSAGDQVILLDNTGFEYVSQIELLTKEEARVRILEQREVKKNLKAELTLFVSIIKKDKMEWVFEKGTELGVSRFVPIVSERTEKKEIHLERAEKIIKEAAEQSGKTALPLLHETRTLAEALEEFSMPCYAFHTNGSKFSEEQIKERIGIFIGPEGGWSEKELAMFEAKKVPIVSMGEEVLRAETAALAAATLVLLS